MKNIISIIMLIIACKTADAQKLDSLYFNLYTDSLKKGTFNYINVDGRFSDGKYLPLTTKELIFTCDAGKFEGNSLYLDTSVKVEKVIVKVSLKSDPAVSRERTIFIKKFEDSSGVKTMEEVMQPKRRKA
ncbi:hypothetical protein [Flavitalea sp.]|nr:hypothetical protein [Flavitalea sp.]